MHYPGGYSLVPTYTFSHVTSSNVSISDYVVIPPFLSYTVCA